MHPKQEIPMLTMSLRETLQVRIFSAPMLLPNVTQGWGLEWV